ncbi:hypothetical protein [Novosphingobium barchaimii]|uniref:hypothetical protein n=1 Tax=Novosphingobium barchaimii TaxID=1420591 RepID=UPI0014701D09|nr:hypothetical protein [Novosphingobium barchaimii]
MAKMAQLAEPKRVRRRRLAAHVIAIAVVHVAVTGQAQDGTAGMTSVLSGRPKPPH